MHRGQTIDAITRQFKENPTDFEEYCAQLFRLQGWIATVTPPSRDGGYDILLQDKRGITCIVECKCYQPSAKIGREAIQKLVGANAIRKANQAMFITTSDYSPDAIQYANQTGVKLVNGSGLIQYAKQCGFGGQSSLPLTQGEWFLTQKDVAKHYPPDYFR